MTGISSILRFSKFLQQFSAYTIAHIQKNTCITFYAASKKSVFCCSLIGLPAVPGRVLRKNGRGTVHSSRALFSIRPAGAARAAAAARRNPPPPPAPSRNHAGVVRIFLHAVQIAIPTRAEPWHVGANHSSYPTLPAGTKSQRHGTIPALRPAPAYANMRASMARLARSAQVGGLQFSNGFGKPATASAFFAFLREHHCACAGRFAQQNARRPNRRRATRPYRHGAEHPGPCGDTPMRYQRQRDEQLP